MIGYHYIGPRPNPKMQKHCKDQCQTFQQAAEEAYQIQVSKELLTNHTIHISIVYQLTKWNYTW